VSCYVIEREYDERIAVYDALTKIGAPAPLPLKKYIGAPLPLNSGEKLALPLPLALISLK